MKFYILDNGFLKTDKNNVVAGANVCTASNPDVKNEFYKMPVMCVLIEHNGRYVLFDTGCHMKSMVDYWDKDLQNLYQLSQTVEQNLEVQLAKCGVRKEQIDTVVLSHMHFDHTGNISLFPNARFYVPKEDFIYAQTAVRVTHNSSEYFGYCKKDLDIVNKYILIDEDIELFPGLELVYLPGHAPGVLGAVVHLEKEGTYIFPMDAVYTAEIYGESPRAAGLVFDRIRYFNSIEKIRRIEEKYNARVIPGHDWDIFQSLKKAPEFYE